MQFTDKIIILKCIMDQLSKWMYVRWTGLLSNPNVLLIMIQKYNKRNKMKECI